MIKMYFRTHKQKLLIERVTRQVLQEEILLPCRKHLMQKLYGAPAKQ